MKTIACTILLCLSAPMAWAGEVAILQAVFTQRGARWDVAVTLQHADSGWRHYADTWRVVGERGEIFGIRTLEHPHDTEQPFTRALSGVAIPASQQVVYVEVHDNVHGWSRQRLAVELYLPQGPGFRIVR